MTCGFVIFKHLHWGRRLPNEVTSVHSFVQRHFKLACYWSLPGGDGKKPGRVMLTLYRLAISASDISFEVSLATALYGVSSKRRRSKMAPPSAVTALREAWGDRELPGITRKITTFVWPAGNSRYVKWLDATYRQNSTKITSTQVKSYMAGSNPPCTVNKGIQMLLENDAKFASHYCVVEAF